MTCPPTDELARALSLPDVPPELVEHLSTCNRCREVLERMDSRLSWEWPAEDGTALNHEPKAWFMDRLKAAVRFTVSEPPGSEEIGPAIPGYAVEEEIARGGMGVVYRARDLALGRTVAIKLVRPEYTARSDQLERFVREAKVLASLQHPNVVQLFQVGEIEGQPFLVMEFVPGGTLRQSLRAGTWDVDACARMIRAITDAVAAAHRIGVVHRDLKPGNILLSNAKSNAATLGADSTLQNIPAVIVPKVADFGLARVQESSERRTQTGEILGTPEYMSPEQTRGDHKTLGPETDVWALGVILYEMLTGRTPFLGTNPVSTMRQVQQAEPIPVETLRPDVPLELGAVCLKCLEKSPSRRYRSAEALRNDLDRFLNGALVSALPRSWLGRLAMRARRRPRSAAMAAAIVLVLVGSLAFAVRARLLLRDADQQHQSEAARLQVEYAALMEELYAARITLAAQAVAAGRTKNAEMLLAACRPSVGGRDYRGWEWYYLSNRLRGEARIDLRPVDAHKHGFNEVHLVPSKETTHPTPGRRAVIDSAGQLLVLDTEGRVLLELPRPPGNLIGVRFSRDGRWLAVRTEDDSITAFDGNPDPQP